MKIVVQRVKKASVKVEAKIVGQIGQGLLLLFGVEEGDGEKEEKILANKVLKLRIFGDKDDKMNLSVLDIKGEILTVSQFTLLADCSGGNRPSFFKAAPPEIAKKIFEKFIEELEKSGLKVESGVFGAKMEVRLVNDGPVTIILEN
jgi:D-aminoacyl-tRNA deacylase